MSLSENRRELLSVAYDKYSDMLFRVALAQLGNSEDAMDAIHDVFLRFHDSRVSFSDQEHERAWFIRVTVNRCHDIQRHKSIRMHASLDEAVNLPFAASEDDGVNQLKRALAAIPEKYRIAVTLHYLEGFSVEEISQMLRIGISGVKMRLSRGREALKSYIEKEEN